MTGTASTTRNLYVRDTILVPYITTSCFCRRPGRTAYVHNITITDPMKRTISHLLFRTHNINIVI